ncbi:MAG: DUF58 domain-containing protein [Actinomycetota bacterium]|nr:DUF58 domain-containing protein [Actinomycetota bacterium]
MTRAGTTASLGALLTLSGWGFGSPSLVVCGVGLAVLAGTAWLWVTLAAHGARFERKPGPTRIVEGDSYRLNVRLRAGLLPPPGGEVSHPLLPEVRQVGPLHARHLDLQIRMPRRGRYQARGGAWTIRDPLGLCSRRVVGTPDGEVLVLPRIEAVEIRSPGVAGSGDGGGGAGDDSVGGVLEARAVEFEVDGLRPYRDGSPASRIHWPAFARSGDLYERRMVASAQPSPLVVLDAMDPASEEALDRAVRAAASLCVHLAASSGCSLLLPGRRNPRALDARLATWPALHAALAVVQAGTPTLIGAAGRGQGSVFLVTAGETESAVRLLPRVGAGPHYVVSALRAAAPAAFRVAGCEGSAIRSRTRASRARSAA